MIMIFHAIIAMLKVERPVTHFALLIMSAFLAMSMLLNGLLMIPEPESYKLYDAPYNSKVTYVLMLSDVLAYYRYHESPAMYSKVPIFLTEMDVYDVACGMITSNMEVGEAERLMFVVTRINENGCTIVGENK